MLDTRWLTIELDQGKFSVHGGFCQLPLPVSKTLTRNYQRTTVGAWRVCGVLVIITVHEWNQRLDGEGISHIGKQSSFLHSVCALTAFWRPQPISSWNQKLERRRCPRMFFSVSGMNSALTLKTFGRKRTNSFCKRGRLFAFVRWHFETGVLLGVIPWRLPTFIAWTNN